MKHKKIVSKPLTASAELVTVELLPQTNADMAALNARYGPAMEAYLKNSFNATEVIYVNPPYYTLKVRKSGTNGTGQGHG